MGSDPELAHFSRVVILRREAGLILISIASGLAVLLVVVLAWVALANNRGSAWLVIPVSLLIALPFGFVCGWSIRHRSSEEPAMILDDAGVFDNISIAKAGRVRWSEIERIWASGPKWMPVLCIVLRDPRAFFERQEEWKRWIMRLNGSFLGAPVVIPSIILQIADDDLWARISRAEISSRPSNATLI